MTFEPTFSRVFSPTFDRRNAGVSYLLLDNFNGSGALAAHTPDIVPVGSSWAIVTGTFANLSGGYLPYTSGNNGRAVIDVGTSNYFLEWRSRYYPGSPTNNYEMGGVLIRSNSIGTDYYTSNYLYLTSGTSHISTSIPNGAFVDTLQVNAARNTFTGVSLSYYEWKAYLYDGWWRIFDSSSVIKMGGQVALKTTNNYVGVYTPQGTNNNSWDYIRVTPLTTAPYQKFSVIGDSISDGVTEWAYRVATQYNNNMWYCANNAASGSTILAHMDGQINASELDNANFTIIALGTNDTTDIEAEYLENLLELWGTLGKPIYCMGVLPKNPNGTRDTINGYISSAVADAQAAGVNVTYWITDGWIDPATDTSDGLHPNAAGTTKITAEVLALLP